MTRFSDANVQEILATGAGVIISGGDGCALNAGMGMVNPINAGTLLFGLSGVLALMRRRAKK